MGLTDRVLLSKEDEAVWKLIKEEGLTARQLSKRLKISRQSAYKHINRLKKKGLIQGTAYRGLTAGGAVSGGGVDNQPSFPMELRLHNQQWKLQLSGKLRQKQPKLFNGVKIVFYGTTSILFQTESISFYGKSTDECFAKSKTFWDGFFKRFEERFNTRILMTELTHKGEIAEIASGFAKAAEKQSLKIVVKDDEDGKRRLLTDFSLNRHETETVHPEKSKDDAKLFMEDILKGWLNGEVMTPRQIQKGLGDLVMHQQAQDYNWRTHQSLLLKLGKAVDRLARSQERKKRPLHQRRLDDYG